MVYGKRYILPLLLLVNMVFNYGIPAGANLDELVIEDSFYPKCLTTANDLFPRNFIQAGKWPTVPGEEIIHQVQRGETLWGIALAYKVTMMDLISLNNRENPDFLLAGEKILIPADKPEIFLQSTWGGTRRVPEGNLIWPVLGPITSYFGMREGRPHQGIDIAADQGTIIRAAAEGQVIIAEEQGTFGLTVVIVHGNGLRTRYAHASMLLVKPGEWVNAGQPVAEVGSTGNSSGPHLHLEVLQNGTPYDPLAFLTGQYK